MRMECLRTGKFTHIVSYTKRLALPLNIRKSEEIQILISAVSGLFQKTNESFQKIETFLRKSFIFIRFIFYSRNS